MSSALPLDQPVEGDVPNHLLSPQQAREQYRRVMERHVARDEGLPPLRVQDHRASTEAGDLSLRVYWPPAHAEDAVPGAVLFFHGGGFVMGDADCYDGMCRRLCRQSGVAVVSVEYRLAPEHPFPCAPNDCLAALLWVWQHGALLGVDASRLAVMGDSAGGNLATVVAMRARYQGARMLRAQVLIYPLTDATRRFSSQSVLQSAQVQQDALWFANHYLPDPNDRSHPDASPLLAPDLAGLPPALVVTAEFDLLREEGEAFAHRLTDAGVATTLRRYNGQEHGFFPGASPVATQEVLPGVALFLSRLLKTTTQG